MQFQDNFVVLEVYRMADPVLKVAVWRGRFEMGDDDAQWYDVEYDPELRPDRLWQKMLEEEIQRRIKFGMTTQRRSNSGQIRTHSKHAEFWHTQRTNRRQSDLKIAVRRTRFFVHASNDCAETSKRSEQPAR